MNPIRILCLGDSLTFGARDEYGRGYPSELMSLFRLDGFTLMAENHGVCGDTSCDLLRKIPDIRGRDYKLAIVMIGTNDTTIPMPMTMFMDNLFTIESLLLPIPILWCTLPPTKGTGLPAYTNPEHIDKYNDGIKSIAQGDYVDFSDMGEYLVDTVHFGNRGYKEMAKRIPDKIGVVSWE